MAMMRQVLAATLALSLTGASLLTGTSLALAQQAPASGDTSWRPSSADVAALTDARVAGLKAGLKLTAEQEKNWPAVETAIRDLAKDRADRVKERAASREARRGGDNARQAEPDAIARLRQGADAMTARAASLKKLADASEPLYKSLDEGQKHRFAMLLRMGGRAGGPGHHWQRRADNAR